MDYTGKELLRIVGWGEPHFENSVSRQRDRCYWVPIPNKLDGDGYISLITGSKGSANYSAWILMVLVASRCEPRGTLVTSVGIPYTPKTLSIKTHALESTFKDGIIALLEIGWIEIVAGVSAPDPAKTQGENGAKYDEFIVLFNRIVGKKYKGDEKSRPKFRARVKAGATLKEFEVAITNAKNNEFHIKKKFVYLTPEYICRDDQFQKWQNVDAQGESSFGEEG